MRNPFELVHKRSILLLAFMLPCMLFGHELMHGLDASASAGATNRKASSFRNVIQAGSDSTKGQQAVEQARAQLDAATAVANARRNVKSAIALQKATEQYDMAVASRVAAITARMNEIYKEAGAGSSGTDPMLSAGAQAEYRGLRNELASYRKTGARASVSEPAGQAAKLANPSIEKPGNNSYVITCPPQPIPSTLGVLGGVFKFTGTAAERPFPR